MWPSVVQKHSLSLARMSFLAESAFGFATFLATAFLATFATAGFFTTTDFLAATFFTGFSTWIFWVGIK